MIYVNMSDAKANFSKYMQNITKGDQIIICKNSKPIAIIKPYRNNGENSKQSITPNKRKVISDLYL